MLSCNPLAACIAAMQARSNKAKESTEGTTMTTAIEVTKREMYAILSSLKHLTCKAENGNLKYGESATMEMQLFESRLEHYLEALRQDRAALVAERDTLRNRVQVLEMANATSGEVIRSLKDEAKEVRKASMKARLAEFATPVSNSAENVASAPLDAKTATILGALVDAQRIMTDYLVPDGIRAKDAMGKLIPVLDNENLFMALRSFEQPEIVFGKDTIWVWTKPHCMHSFHPAFPSGELCTFCGVGK